MAFIEGDDNANTLNGTAAADVIFGYGGDDTLIGWDGNDLLIGGSGDDTVFGAEGDDTLAGEEGEDWLHGGNGNDTVSYAGTDIGVFVDLVAQTGSVGSEVDGYRSIENALGSSYGDVLFGNGGVNRLTGGRGDDLIRGGAGGDLLAGGQGVDTATYADAAAGIWARLAEGRVDELLPVGGFTTDILSGIENVSGSSHSDLLEGDANANVLSGGGGNDRMYGEGGADRLSGGSGYDSTGYSHSPAGVVVDLALGVGHGGTAEGDTFSGIESVEGSPFADVITGDASANYFSGGVGDDVLTGGAGADTLGGNNGNDTALGGTGNDTLNGGGEADTLRGEAGNDLLRGQTGQDTLFGGDGADVLDFNATYESAVGADRDRVYGFVSGQDDIDLGTIDANTALTGDQAFAFIGAALFSGTAGELRYNANGVLQGDVDGDAVSDFQILLEGVPALAAADLIL